MWSPLGSEGSGRLFTKWTREPLCRPTESESLEGRSGVLPLSNSPTEVDEVTTPQNLVSWKEKVGGVQFSTSPFTSLCHSHHRNASASPNRTEYWGIRFFIHLANAAVHIGKFENPGGGGKRSLIHWFNTVRKAKLLINYFLLETKFWRKAFYANLSKMSLKYSKANKIEKSTHWELRNLIIHKMFNDKWFL